MRNYLIICPILIFCFFISLSAASQSARSVISTDTDGDGIPDFWEKRYANSSSGLNPGDDNDNDGLNNYDEYQAGSNPLEPDSDEDGLGDSQEVRQYYTDPVMEDTDQGGVSDNYEVMNGSSPLDPLDDDKFNNNLFSIKLKQGANLISIPISPASRSITDVLSSIEGSFASVWSYQNGTWLMFNPDNPKFSDLTTFEPGWGYWIHMKNTDTLNVNGTPAPKIIHLEKGTNLVGYNSLFAASSSDVFSSINNNLIKIWSYQNTIWRMFNPANPKFSDLNIMEPGYGYWIYTKDKCDWNF